MVKVLVKPELSDGIINLRAYKKADALIIYEAVRESIEMLKPWMGWCSEWYELKDTEDYLKICKEGWEKGRMYDFGIFSASDGRFLGGCGLNRVGNYSHQLNMGYWVRRSEMGKGYASRAAKLLTLWAFENTGICRLEISAGVENKASQRVAQKAGAKREALLRSYVDVRGKAMDCYVCSITPKDLPEVLGKSIGNKY